MNISEAIPFLLNKHYIRRKAWRQECDIAIFGGVVNMSGFRVIFEEDLMADDWEVIPFNKNEEVE